jgi:hypothetical protein
MQPVLRTTPAFWVILVSVIVGVTVWRLHDTASSVSAPPPRPDHVPEQAIWSGGPDGGWFFDCRLSEALECTIYDEESGTIVKAGTVVLTDWQKVKYRSIADVYADLDYFDGERIQFISRTTSALR